MTNNKIIVGTVEFDQIKANFIEYLKNQDTFSDFVFEGSNLSILLDVLAYNTYYNVIYNNMALNEAFLDTASKRQSVVSLSKALGYTPRSAKCAESRISFKINDPDNIIQQTTILLPRLTSFTGTKENQRFSFLSTETLSSNIKTGNSFIFENVRVIEGTPVQSKYTYNQNLNSIVLPNKNIDLDTLVVRIQKEGSTVYEDYLYANKQERLDGNSLVYFVKETEEEYYELSFGDGILGNLVENGSTVNVYYFICNGIESNGIRKLTYNGPSFSGILPSKITDNTPGIDTLEPTNGGRFPETIEQIRFNAPNMYAAQNRAVTTKDYETIILNKVPSVKTVTVWGGENNKPPVFGKVFISVDTFTGKKLTTQEENFIKTYVLEKYKLITVIPEFVQADYLNIELDVVCYYDENKMVAGIGINDLITNIRQDISVYNTSKLQKFQRILRTTDITRLVESVDPSIISSVIRIRIYRTVNPRYFVDYNYIINTGNPMVKGSIKSNGFYINQLNVKCFIDDDSNGNLRLFYKKGTERIDIRTIGTVDYNNGNFSINGLNIVKLDEAQFLFSFIPSSNDVAGMPNQIVQINEDKLKISLIGDQTTDGRINRGDTYTFTSNRL